MQQTESPFTVEVLHFPLPAKFRMPQVEAFDGARDPVDHLNTYKNQMKLHGYQDLYDAELFLSRNRSVVALAAARGNIQNETTSKMSLMVLK